MGSCKENEPQMKCAWVLGPIIVGAGPSGLAVAACLSQHGVPSVLLEKSDCIASLWQYRTYDRLMLHLPKHFCELPLLGFPEDFPEYPSRQQFISYIESYAARFSIKPRFRQWVKTAEFDSSCGLWRVRTQDIEYFSRWLIVATGENAEPVIPEISGIDKFRGPVMHSSDYKSGADFQNQKVLVVGCGNSGMEVSLDLVSHHAVPHMVVRSTVSFRILSISYLRCSMKLDSSSSILQLLIWVYLISIRPFSMKFVGSGACSTERDVRIINLWNSHGSSEMASLKAGRQVSPTSIKHHHRQH
uniref:indole-3-pyruvate monooxygenase n=1 Tax=Nelumbo nucifera TaxID=4432 RepID=A0A822ZMQ4_NELNU|nr:TPA_asm: hypothetical protein HUJ06_003031 [Nelumbo nucifera]